MKVILLSLASALSLSRDAKGSEIKTNYDPQFVDNKPYTRSMPEMYRENNPWEDMYKTEKVPHDRLMNSIIKNHAKEGKDQDGKPNGRFYVDKANALIMSKPFITKYLKLGEKNMDFFIANDFEDNINRFDVLGTGFIEAEQMGRFIQTLVHEPTLDVGF